MVESMEGKMYESALQFYGVSEDDLMDDIERPYLKSY